MRRRTLALGGALALAVALATGGTALAEEEGAAQDTGTVYVVHGVPDTPVDVYVDGQRAIDDFQPGTSQGPVELPAGSHQVALFPADAADGSGSPLLSASADVPSGGNVTLAAHLDEGGNPKISPFVNDVGSVPAGQARLVVRHTAAAPAVDVLAGGQPVIEGLSNGSQRALEVPAGSVSAAVAAAGTTNPVIGPADLNLQEGTATFVHAVGKLDGGQLSLVTFTVSNLHSSPSGVPSGAPSGAPADHGVPAWLLVTAIAGLAVVGVSVRRLRPRGQS
jgi:Domain of unknown function (DUF4397)